MVLLVSYLIVVVMGGEPITLKGKLAANVCAIGEDMNLTVRDISLDCDMDLSSGLVYDGGMNGWLDGRMNVPRVIRRLL